MVLGRFIDIVCWIAAAAMMATIGATGDARAAAYDTSRLDRMPDFSQTDKRLQLPGGGSHYCVPVATANVLVWLAEHKGYKNLLPVQGLSTIEKVASVAGRLGSSEFMSTAPKGGTNLQRFVNGLNGYIKQQGYRPDIEAHGVHKFRGVSRSNAGAPDWREIRSKFARGAGVWVSVSFFKEGRRRGELTRVGGHMTTMAGFGVNKRGSTDRDVIILHDPDDGRRGQVQRRYLEPEEVRGETGIAGSHKYDLDGYLDVSGSFRMRKGYRAIITHVFVLDI